MGKIQVLSHMPMSGAKSENYASAIQRLTDSKTLEKANARQSPYARSLSPSDARDIGPQQLDSKNSHRLQGIIMGIIIWYNKCQEP
jgi:hypothetical protein